MSPELLNDLIVEFGADSDVVKLAPHYITDKDDQHEFSRLINMMEVSDGRGDFALKAILWLIEIKAIRQRGSFADQLDRAKQSKQGLIDLLMYDGADSYETIMLIEDHMTDDDVVEFMQVWDLDFDSLYDQLIEFIDVKIKDMCA